MVNRKNSADIKKASTSFCVASSSCAHRAGKFLKEFGEEGGVHRGD